MAMSMKLFQFCKTQLFWLNLCRWTLWLAFLKKKPHCDGWSSNVQISGGVTHQLSLECAKWLIHLSGYLHFISIAIHCYLHQKIPTAFTCSLEIQRITSSSPGNAVLDSYLLGAHIIIIIIPITDWTLPCTRHCPSIFISITSLIFTTVL